MREDLKSLWLTETVRLVEKDSGRFADQDANRQAKANKGAFTDRLIMRAEILSKQNGLLSAQQLLLNGVKFSLIILLIFSIIMGCTLALSTLSQNPVNLYWALFSLLGLHLITLFIWLFSSLCLSRGSGSLFIYCWLWLAQKFSQKQTIKQLIPSFITLFSHHIRWLVGFIVNLLWTVILCSALIILLMLFSTKHYSFEWKTTLLSSDAVISITHYLGQLPNMLGFTMPNDEIIRMSEQAISSGDVRSAWAIWLLGVFIVYGIAVRFLLMLFCGFKWLYSCKTIKLDLSHPEYQLLTGELQPLATQIVDSDTESSLFKSMTYSEINNHVNHNNGTFLVAIDIEDNWTPPDFVTFLGFLNTNEQRKHILDSLQLSPAKKLLIAIDTDRTPDRGMLNLINQLITKSQQNRIWFINQGKQFNNWQELAFQLATPTWLTEAE